MPASPRLADAGYNSLHARFTTLTGLIIGHPIGHLLFFLTNFGDPYLTGPLAAFIFLWLGFIRAWRALITWAVCFSTGAAIVAATKVAYAGWGIEVQALHFTVVSGHTMLASAVYPTVCAICATHTRRHSVLNMFLGGLAFALVIGISRKLFGFHTTAEVVTGMALGTLVATLTCAPMFKRQAGYVVEQVTGSARTVALRRDLTTTYAAIALAIVVVCHGRIAPVSTWIDMKAPHWQQTITTKLDDTR